MRASLFIAIVLASSALAGVAAAQPDGDPNTAPHARTSPTPSPASTPPATPPPAPEGEPVLIEPPKIGVVPPEDDPRDHMSEGRLLVSLYNSGFQLNISPGIAIVDGEAGFLLGLRVGYGWDSGSVILVPGIRGVGYFTDPNVFIGMPVLKVVFPIDAFAPFVEAGGGVGNVGGTTTTPAKAGIAVLGGVGFMYHFSPRFALGLQGSYEIIGGTHFEGIGAGPILAFGF